jgi:hypothetical protein
VTKAGFAAFRELAWELASEDANDRGRDCYWADGARVAQGWEGKGKGKGKGGGESA